MHTCPNMQKVALQLIALYDWHPSPGDVMVLAMPPYQDLAFARLGRHLMSVAHQYHQEGDRMYDPEIVFFTGGAAWVPFSITQSPVGVYREVAVLTPDGSRIARIQPTGLRDVARFAELWARNLVAQGWLDSATLVGKTESEDDEPPTQERPAPPPLG